MDWNLWDKANFYGRFDKILWDFDKNHFGAPQNSQKPLFKCKKLVINTTKWDLCLFLHKMCCILKMVSKFCEIWKISYGNWLPDGPNSVRFYLTVWDMACLANTSTEKVLMFCHFSVFVARSWKICVILQGEILGWKCKAGWLIIFITFSLKVTQLPELKFT